MKYLIFIFTVTCSQILSGQSRHSELIQILDTIISKSKEISLYSEDVSWDSLSTEVYLAAKNVQELTDLKPALEVLLNGLRDHHGQFRETENYSIIANFTDYSNIRIKDEREFNQETWKFINNPESKYEWALLENNIGYLKVVGVGSNIDGQKETERIRNSIMNMHNQRVEKWVIDLRYNGGGNINVMLAGLAPLLDAKEVASIIDKDGTAIGRAEIDDGNFWYFGVNAFPIEEKVELKNPKIAILTSRWTVSSGELVAIAFKGQSNTKFFGEATGGYTTNTGWEIINGELAMILGTGVFSDREGKLYSENVKPDKVVLFEIEHEREKDTAIIEAIDWLIEK